MMPIPPIHRSAARAINVYGLGSSAHRTVATVPAMRMMTPPIVGTAAFSLRFASTCALPVSL